MENLPQLVARLREERGWTMTALAARINSESLSKYRISAKERGQESFTRNDVPLLAAAFEIPVDKFREMFAGLRSEILGRERDAGIPIINSAPAGLAINYEEYGVDSSQGFAYLPRDPETMHQGLFAVIVVGDSMAPSLADGDILILHPVDAESPDGLYSGRTVFVRLAGEEGCMIARWQPVDDSRVKLTKDNPKHRARSVRRDEIERVAVAVQLRRKVR